MFIKMLLSLKMYEKKENLKALYNSMVDAIAREDERFDVRNLLSIYTCIFFLTDFLYFIYLQPSNENSVQKFILCGKTSIQFFEVTLYGIY